jgi:hypothetical protein
MICRLLLGLGMAAKLGEEKKCDEEGSVIAWATCKDATFPLNRGPVFII